MKKLFFVLTFLIILSLPKPTIQAHELKGATKKVKPFSPETIVAKQLRAYSARDLKAFLICFSDEVEVYTFPDQLMYKGKEKLEETYRAFFQNTPDLQCELVNRSANGNHVKDEILITRMKKMEPMKVTVMYVVEDGLIAKMYFIS